MDTYPRSARYHEMVSRSRSRPVREYKKVASLIVNNRPFNSSKELADFLSKKMPKGKLHAATLPFQGIRIEVNDELGVLERLFDSLENAKFKNCIVAIISFHSLEDRIVKNYFKKWSKSCICPENPDIVTGKH